MSYAQHQRRLRYWRDYYRRRRSRIFHRTGRTVISARIEATFRSATPIDSRLIQGRHRVINRKSTITRLRLSIAGKRRQYTLKQHAAFLLGTRRGGQLRRGSRVRKGI